MDLSLSPVSTNSEEIYTPSPQYNPPPPSPRKDYHSPRMISPLPLKKMEVGTKREKIDYVKFIEECKPHPPLHSPTSTLTHLPPSPLTTLPNSSQLQRLHHPIHHPPLLQQLQHTIFIESSRTAYAEWSTERMRTIHTWLLLSVTCCHYDVIVTVYI